MWDGSSRVVPHFCHINYYKIGAEICEALQAFTMLMNGQFLFCTDFFQAMLIKYYKFNIHLLIHSAFDLTICTFAVSFFPADSAKPIYE